MSKNWYPVIDQETCIGCGRCIEHCCRGVYDISKSHPVVIHPENCPDGCKGCEKVCPTHSITHHGDSGRPDSCGCSGSCGCEKC